tara:strand:- start:346 stop:492 length:147 start_codon:yes stop_codon:yes gene_type:complete
MPSHYKNGNGKMNGNKKPMNGKKAPKAGKGSKAMKDKMARLRAMKSKK